MQDQRRRGSDGNVVDHAVEKAVQTMIKDLPQHEQFALLRRLRSSLGDLLTTAPSTNPDVVQDLENRALLAAAFRVKLPGDEG